MARNSDFLSKMEFNCDFFSICIYEYLHFCLYNIFIKNFDITGICIVLFGECNKWYYILNCVEKLNCNLVYINI